MGRVLGAEKACPPPRLGYSRAPREGVGATTVIFVTWEGAGRPSSPLRASECRGNDTPRGGAMCKEFGTHDVV